MAEIHYVSRKEMTADEILGVLNRGGRVVIELAVIGKTMNVVIRKSDETYYCDTPMKLMKYDDPSGLKACLERFNMVRYEQDGTELPAASSSLVEG